MSAPQARSSRLARALSNGAERPRRALKRTPARRRGLKARTRLFVLICTSFWSIGLLDVLRAHGFPPAFERAEIASWFYDAWPEWRPQAPSAPNAAPAPGHAPDSYWRRAGLRLSVWLLAPLLAVWALRILLESAFWIARGLLPKRLPSSTDPSRERGNSARRNT